MRNGYKKPLIVGLVILGVILLLRYLGVGEYLSLQALKNNREYLMHKVDENYMRSSIIYIVLYTTAIALAIPAVPPLTIFGGFLFGFIPSVFFSLLSCTLGSTISFLLARYVTRTTIAKRYEQQLERFNVQMKNYGATYLLTLQLASIIPYFVINTLAALANVPLSVFMWTTIVGALPIIVVYSFAGQQLYSIESIRDIFSPQIIIAFVLLILLSLMPMLIARFRRPINVLDEE